jgi:hypothetical protein
MYKKLEFLFAPEKSLDFMPLKMCDIQGFHKLILLICVKTTLYILLDQIKPFRSYLFFVFSDLCEVVKKQL